MADAPGAERYPHLFEPITIGGVTFRNRVFTAPMMHHMIQHNATYPEDSFIVSYAQTAKGGAAQVCCGGQIVLRGDDSPFHARFDISDPAAWRSFIHLSDAVHLYGAKASYELIHFGGEEEVSPERLAKGPVYACSEHTRADGTHFAQMTYDEMDRVADRYAELARCVRLCGFDTLLIHGGHGTLLQEFVSPRSNHRTDEYGGSMENRARFPLMVLDRIRAAVGHDLLIEYRISGSECVPGGFEVEDCVDFLELIQDRIDIAHISAGVVREPRLRAVTHPTGFLPEGCNAHLARAVRQSGRVHVPVLTLGAFQHPAAIERALAEGDADLVALARALIADPYLVEKAYRGNEDQVTPCIQCFRCLDEFKDTHRYLCSVNPRAGQELLLTELEPRRYERLRIGVVGGGPAGMSAALEAAERGHEVVLFEVSAHLGGELRLVERVGFKRGLTEYASYLRRRLAASPVEVRLGTRPTPEALASEGFDEVIVAVGAEPVLPSLPGAHGDKVLWAGRALAAPELVGRRVAVVGSGEVGCETAIWLASHGHEVTLLARGDALARHAMRTYREELVGQLDDAGVRVLLRARATAFDEGGVTYADPDGAPAHVDADTVLYAVGMRPRTEEAERYCACAPVFRCIGDCERAGSVATATWQAYSAAASAGAEPAY